MSDNPYRLTYSQCGNTFVCERRFVWRRWRKVEQVLVGGLGAMGVGQMWFDVTPYHRRMRGYKRVTRGQTFNLMCGWVRNPTRCERLRAWRPPLDAAAALCTGSSTLLLAFHMRSGWLTLAAGVCFWMAVALKGRLGDRPIWWMLAANIWTFTWALYGYVNWGNE